VLLREEVQLLEDVLLREEVQLLEDVLLREEVQLLEGLRELIAGEHKDVLIAGEHKDVLIAGEHVVSKFEGIVYNNKRINNKG
jgi:CO dehydrogenase/acetyl-CoA synthase gamma subunit (corrinoid Fe-S protein)